MLAPLVSDGRRWTWDAGHNPDPLSIAQGELVELVDRAGVAPWAMRVCGGYLYTAPRTATRRAGTIDVGDLEAEMAEVLGDDVPPVEEALVRYVDFYRLWSELSGIVARHDERPPTFDRSRDIVARTLRSRGDRSAWSCSRRHGTWPCRHTENALTS